jgi:hypothetical protein
LRADSPVAHSCIALNCGEYGFRVTWSGTVTLINCDAINSTSDGVNFSAAGYLTMINCNLVGNGGYGVNLAAQSLATCRLVNCGSYNNALGRTAGDGLIDDESPIEYTSHPYANSAEGDFTLVNGEALGAGRGAFLFTGTDYDDRAKTVSAVDVGAVQSRIRGPLIGGRLVR